MAQESLNLTVSQLIEKLQKFSPDAKVRVMTTHDDGDDVTDWEVVAVHDGWSLQKEGDLISIEIDLDQRPTYFNKWADTADSTE